MGQRMNIKEAASAVGLSEWELRQGIRGGRYPALKVGIGKGKYILDIELLEARIQELMQMNVAPERNSQEIRGQIRPIA